MKTIQFIRYMKSLLATAAAALVLAGLSASAQTTYIWKVNAAGNASGSWTSGVNWNPAQVPQLQGGSAIASFPTNITVASTITLDGADATGTGTFGTLNVVGGGSADFTFNAGTPSTSKMIFAPSSGNGNITVSGRTVTINAVVDGTGGLVKNGGGNLILTANNTFTGSFTNAAGGTTTLSGNNAYTGGTFLTGGTLSISTDANIGGTTTAVNFLGGGLQITGTTINNLNTHTVNWAGFNGTLDINNAANTFSVNSAISGTGALTKNGAGILVLNNPDARTGNTTINAGKLVMNAGSPLLGGTVTLAGGAVLDVSALASPYVITNQTVSGTGGIKASVTFATGARVIPGGTGAVGQLSISNNLILTGQTITFDMRTNAAPTSDLIAVGGTATLNSNIVVSLNYLTALTNGTYPILTSAGLNLNGNTVILDRNYRNVSLNVTATGISVVVAAGGAAGKSLTWVGGASNPWDIGVTSDWNDGVGANTYFDLDTVTFNDTGSASPALALNTNVFPASVTFANSSQNYTLSGTGKITGTASLTKSGTGTVTIGTANDFTGATTLAGGKIVLSGGDNRLPNTALNITTNAAFDLGGNNQRIASIILTGNSNSLYTTSVSNGNLTVSGSGNINVASGGTNTMDFSGLSGLFYTNSTQTFGVQSSTGVSNGTVIINFAANGLGTNFIAAAAVNVQAGGAAIGSGSTKAITYLHLGPWNTIWTPSFNLGAFRSQIASMDFQPGMTTSNLTVMGPGGTSRVGFITIGNCNSGNGAVTGIVDVAFGTFNCQATNMDIAQMNTGANAANGTLNLGNSAGVFDCLNATNASKLTGTGATPSTGTINQYGSTAKFGNLVMGANYGTAAGPIMKSAYNLNGGTLFAQTIQPGADGVSVGAGSFRLINWTNGTIRNYDSSTPLTVLGNPGSTAPMTIAAPGSGNRSFVVDSGLTTTLQCALSSVTVGSTPVVMSGPGTLDIQGSMDDTLFSLNVSNGIVLLDKSSSATVHAIGSLLTLNGGTVQLSGSGGDQITNNSVVTINSGTFDLNGQVEIIAGLTGLGGTLADVVTGGTLTVNMAGGVTNISSANITGGNLVFAGSGMQVFTGTDTRSGTTTTVSGGTLQIGNGAAAGSLAGDVTLTAPGTLAYNRTGTTTYAGTLSGTGNLAQNGSGTLNLSGADTRTAGSILVNTGTVAIATATGVGGTFVTVAKGGTFNVTGSGGSFVIGTGQTITGSGAVTGSFSVATGATNSGNLTVTGNVTMQDGSVFNPGAAFTAGTITVNGNFANQNNNVLIYNLAANNTPGGGTNSLLVVSGNLDLGSGGNAPTLIIHGSPVNGTYVLATFGTFTGNAAALTVVGSARYSYTPQVVGNQLRLVVVGAPQNLAWRGDGGANTWDNTPANTDWFNTSSNYADYFSTGDFVQFNDTSTNPIVNLTTTVSPGSITVTGTTNFTFANGGGAIDGPIPFTKSGASTLTIQNNNTFSGLVNLNGGTISVGSVALNGDASPLGAGSTLAFNGGALQYTGGAVDGTSFNRSLTIGASGATIDQSGSGAFAVTNSITGVGSLTKLGAQQLILGDGANGTGSNSYSGITYVANGNLQIQNATALGTTVGKTVVTSPGFLNAAGGFTGSIMENLDLSGSGDGNGALQSGGGGFNYAGNVTLVANAAIGGGNNTTISGPIGGAGQLEKLGVGTLTLLNNTNVYTGGTVISGGYLNLGTNGTTGWLPPQPSGVALTNNGNLVFNRSDTNAYNDRITGTGGLVIAGTGQIVLGASNDFSGNIAVQAGVLLVTNDYGLGDNIGNTTIGGGTTPGYVALAGGRSLAEPFILSQKNSQNNFIGFQPPDLSNVSGTNTVTSPITMNGGGNYWAINSDAGLFVLGAINSTPGSFVRPLFLEGAGNGFISGPISDLATANLKITKVGAGTWTANDTASLNRGIEVQQGTMIMNGNVDAGAGVAMVLSTVANGSLIINAQLQGPITVNLGGTLAGVGTIAGVVTVQTGGTLAPGTNGIGTLTLNNNLVLSGNATFKVNKSLSQSNDLVVVAGVLTNSAVNSVTITNLGPALVAGDTFTLFSQPVINGGALNIVGGGTGVTWTNKLALNGSIVVLSVASPVNTNTFAIGNVVSGNNLNLTWPPDRLGWRLQVQTNSLNNGLGNTWFNWPNSTTVTNVSLPLNPANPSVFFRMVYP